MKTEDYLDYRVVADPKEPVFKTPAQEWFEAAYDSRFLKETVINNLRRALIEQPLWKTYITREVSEPIERALISVVYEVIDAYIRETSTKD